MCGILGVFDRNSDKKYDFQQMLGTLVHRGPDNTGIFTEGNLTLGHQRLSIVDVEGAHQPFCNEEHKLYAICNGEIYNHRELRSRVDDYAFRSQGDSEVLLPLYQQFGSELTSQLDGMFGFFLSKGEEFLAARDPIGIKPLYYGKKDDSWFFSSEIKAIVDRVDEIYEFPNGYYYRSGQGFSPYYQLPEEQPFLKDLEVIIPKIQQSLAKSVQKRLMSDVPVGVFLSGGLDSSIIAAVMREQVTGELHSFSVGLPNSPDLKAARMVAEHIGTIHHEYVYTEAEMLEILSDVIYYLESFDPALVRSAIPCYIVSRLASKYVKVVLSGEGADELYAGYSYFVDYEDPDALHKESITIVKGLHNLNLQRVDRMTMAHSIEGRVPFLDTDFIKLSLSIDPKLKLYKTFGIEKWLLRKAFEDKLPHEIVWRDKMEFAQGCASSTILQDHAEANIDKQEVEKAIADGLPISSKEELFYFRIFQDHFPHPNAANLIGRWQGTLH